MATSNIEGLPDPVKSGWLYTAITEECPDAVRFLLGMGAKAEKLHFRLANRLHLTDIMEILMEDGVPDGVDIDELLFDALGYGVNDMVILLIKKGANINAHGGEHLRRGCYFGDADLLRELISLGADVAKYGKGLVKICETEGYFDALKVILEAGAPPTELSKDIMTAIDKGFREAVFLLIRNHMDKGARAKAIKALTQHT